MNASILGRILMAGSEPSSDGKLWVVPVVLELFAFPFAWISVQMLHDHEPWSAITKYALAGIALSITGVTWAVFRKRIAELWPWHKLGIARADLAKVLQENSELRKRLDAPEEIIALRPAQNYLAGPPHHVKCLGVEIDGPFVSIGFQNVMIPGEPVGDFRNARVSIQFTSTETGKEILTIFPARWASFEQDDIPIGVVPQHAILASYNHPNKQWEALSTSGVPSDGPAWSFRLEHTRLPFGKLKINVTLIGEHNISLPPYEGILTLSKDGTATFQSMSD